MQVQIVFEQSQKEIHSQQLKIQALFSEEQVNPCIELACWAHARRKFFDLYKANNNPINSRIDELLTLPPEVIEALKRKV